MNTLIRLICCFIIGYFILVFFLPNNMPLGDIIKNIFMVAYVDVPEWIFYIFLGFKDYLINVDNSNYNFIQDFGWMLLLAGTLILAFALPILCWIVITFILWAILHTIAPKIAIGIINILGGSSVFASPDAQNMMHLLNGRTTIQDTFDADVQANAIANALNRK